MSLIDVIARMIESALAAYEPPAGKIRDQLAGSQVAPAAAGSPGVVALSTATPAALGAAAPGSSGAASDAGHVHAMPSAADVGAEPALGNPGTSGFVLSSTTAGVRSWVAGGGMADPTTTAGDLIYRGAISVTRLGIGDAGTFLRVVGGAPAWAALTWAMVGSTPTTLAGYGIGDAAPLSHVSDTANPHGTTAEQAGAIPTSALTAAAPAALAASAAPGSSSNVARLDHQHPYPTAANVGAAAASHTHAASAITSGVLAVARGGTGVGVMPAFTVTRTTNQTGILSGVATKILWTTEIADTANSFDLANSRVVLDAGSWIMTCSAVFALMTPPANSAINFYLYKNGSLFMSPIGIYIPNLAGYYGLLIPIIVAGCNGSDYYELYISQSSGSTQTLVGNSVLATAWSGVRT